MIATFTPLGYMGELGNQMFQIAAVTGYARKYAKTPKFPEWTCKISGKDYRNGIFKHSLPLLAPEESMSIHHTVNYQGLTYVDLQNLQGNVNFAGYFQSEKYFENCKDEIREIFKPHQNIEKYIHEKYNEVLSTEKKVSLQIRTGSRSSNDYDVHAYATREFIESAQRNYDEDSSFVVFADNMSIAKQILPADRKYIFIEGEENYIDLFIMNKFDEYIVSASTFGWWGAWLSQNKNPKVSIMKDWFVKGRAKESLNQNNDQVPERWIKISQ
jgi:hypothetical protein